jgi:soluble P-type ATPase
MRSEHPLGKAIVAYAVAAGIAVSEPDQFDYTPGKGISASLNGSTILVGSRLMMAAHAIKLSAITRPVADAGSEVLVGRDGHFLGAILIGDTVRPEAQRAIASFDRLGIRCILLSGDSQAVANAVGRRLGIKRVEAELLPDAKLARIKEFVAAGRVVAMVGDGINDAPALAEANVGVAMGSGTELAGRCSSEIAGQEEEMRRLLAVAGLIGLLYKRAHQDLDAAREDLESVRLQTEGTVTALYRQSLRSRETALVYRNTLVPLAHQAFEEMLVAYQSGKTDFTTLISTFRQWHDARSAYRQAVNALLAGKVALEQAAGGSLQ